MGQGRGGQGDRPRTVLTTLNITHNSTISRTANGLSGTVTTHTREFGDGVTRNYFDDSWSLTLAGNTITGSHSVKYQKGGQTHTLVFTLNGLYDPQTFDFSGTVNVTEDGQPKGSYSFYVDGFWKKLWHAAATIVTGAACYIATGAVAAATGVATAATLGAAGPAAVAGTALTAGASGLVTAEVYDATK